MEKIKYQDVCKLSIIRKRQESYGEYHQEQFPFPVRFFASLSCQWNGSCHAWKV